MTLVAIHQPNYAPWLGYFHKLARADIFVFLDDVQFSKQSYTNRVQILGPDGPRWLTQPVRVSLGDSINRVMVSRKDWVRAHLDTLRGFYGSAPAFRQVWPELHDIYDGIASEVLSEINQHLVEALAKRLKVGVRFVRSADLDTGDLAGEERLISIVDQLAPGGAYLSGKGGATYQDEAKFGNAGLALRYTNFDHPEYDQGRLAYSPGLSILDAVFHLGWDDTAALVRR